MNQNPIKTTKVMSKIIVTIVLFISSYVSAQGQFEQGMGQALQLWGEGKSTEASALFERIAAAEKSSWLPNYYVALVNPNAAFAAIIPAPFLEPTTTFR